MNIPRPEHPNPQWERKNWLNLNGVWEFEFDFGQSAVERELWKKEKLSQEITVPFCPESRLSGITYTDFMPAVAYRKKIELTKAQCSNTVYLHFGAVDYFTKLFVNGVLVGTHKGGYTSFCFDITSYVAPGENDIFLSVEDDTRNVLQPSGKQSVQYASAGCSYTRTTGIWQTVWLEFRPKTHITSAKFYPDPENRLLTVVGCVTGPADLKVQALWENVVQAETKMYVNGGFFSVQLQFKDVHFWEAGKGGLYELIITFGEDEVYSYFGMRSTKFSGRKYMLNGKSLFQRTVLDQGYYREGIYTAPTDADLVQDIELSYAAGFNGARLHQKVFEPRFLYHCDRLGYLVWGEYPNWGMDYANPLATEIYMNEWQESVERDFNHPSIIGWCPFNETWDYFERKAQNALISSIYYLTKRLDPTRPCIDTSGSFHEVMEVYDIHDYEQDVATFKTRWDDFTSEILKNSGQLPAGSAYFAAGQTNGRNHPPYFAQDYSGQPVFISEYGGIAWIKNATEGWGYGETPKSEEEFFARYKGLTDAMLQNKEIFGFCYTQLYDIEQEINGLYTYDRECKFDINKIKEINIQPAAIEEE